MWKQYHRVTFNADGGAGGGAAGADPGAGGDQGGAGGGENLGWRAGLPVEYRDHEFVKGFGKVGDFVKTALELKTGHDDLTGKMANAIIKPGENATPEERAAYQKALGVPETPDTYEFPKGEGVEHDEKMLDWARQTFHQAGLTPDQAKVMSTAWDGFVQELAKSQETAAQEGVKAATETLKGEWKADYDKNIEITKRGYQAFEKVSPGFAELLDMDVAGGLKVGNDPRMLKVFHAIGQAIGDDLTFPAATPPGEQKKQGGFQDIYKIKNPAAPA